MKKMLYLIVVILVISFGLGIALSMFDSGKQLSITKTGNIVIGPYTCGDKTLTIETKFHINNLEGAHYLKDILVSFGPLEFRRDEVYKQKIEEKMGKTFGYDEYRDHLESTKTGVSLPSQEELMSRGWRPEYNGSIWLVSTSSSATQADMQEFAECFSKNRMAIYDRITDKKAPLPVPIWFNKAYLVKDLDK